MAALSARRNQPERRGHELRRDRDRAAPGIRRRVRAQAPRRATRFGHRGAPAREGEIPVDLAGFPASPLATDEYGRQLAARLFADRDVWTCFERLRGGATPLRVRL